MKSHAGFTLIEVLVTSLVLSVGLLGIAGLQATGLKNNQGSYNRSKATHLAYSLADRMRVNALSLATYTSMGLGAAGAKPACLTKAGCTPAEMAENDLYEWNLAVNTNFPNSTRTITVTANVYTITITWDDDHNSVTDDTTFATSFQL